MEEKEPFSLKAPFASQIVYHFNFKSFDYQNSTVRGNLKLHFPPILYLKHQHEVKYSFSPLVYYDGASNFVLGGLRSKKEIDVMTSLAAQAKKQFKEQEPAPITFQFEALGEPKFYPFDMYLLVGSAKCLIMEKTPNGRSRELHTEKQPAITVSLDIPGFFIRLARFNEVKGLGWDRPDDQAEKLNFKNWNKGSTFLLILQRPLFLRFMSVLLGITAFFSILYIILLRPLSNIPINAIAYFVALWAIRGVLSQGIEVFPTFIDYGTLLLYSMLIFGALAKLVWPKKS